MYKEPFIPIKVYKWISSTEKELYVFDDTGTYAGPGTIIHESIYQDNRIEDAINKIAVYLKKNNTESFYAWTKGKALQFSVDKVYWDGYDINPFKARDLKSPSINETIQYTFHNNNLFSYTSINIVFANDLPKELKSNKYYFTGMKVQTYKYYKKHDEILFNLRKNNTQNVKLLQEFYHRVSLYDKLDVVILAQLFDKLHASKYVDMIQWVDDTSKLLYKLYKYHRIKKEYFDTWTNVDKLNKINVINIYSILNKNSYCKISIDNEGNILFSYILDNRAYIKWSDIDKHREFLVKFLQNSLRTSIKLQIISMNVYGKLEVYNSSLTLLAKKLSEYIDIFHLKTDANKSKHVLICTYKRTSNYEQNMDIYDYIKSRLNIGIPKVEIMQELTNLGVTGNLEDMFDNEVPDNIKINIQNNGTILVIEPYSQGYNISITNCANKQELQYLYYWLCKIVSVTIGKIEAKTKKLPSPPPVQKTPSSSASTTSSSVSHGSIDFDLDSMDSMKSGGAPRKTEKSNYLINMLHQADKELFGENYARDKCQNPSQPVVFSKQYKEHLERTNQLDFDNIVEYGSSEHNQNFYACPRLWCPQSKVPLAVDDANAKCPIENEEPMQMFWDNDKNKKRYVKLIKPNEKGICVPCCMKKEPKTDEINKCKAFLKSDIVKPLQIPPKEDIADIAENYIMNQSAPIPVGRFGNIPEYLHKILFDKQDIEHSACSKTLNKIHHCFVRKGIVNNRHNSVILALSEVTGFNNKKAFIKDIKKKLDLITFVSLDSGNVCKEFMSISEIIPEDANRLLKDFNLFQKNPLTSALCNFDITSINISRILNIYYAYKRFLLYLESDNYPNEISPVFLYSLINVIYNITVLIFEKVNKHNDIYMHCPTQTTVDYDLNPTICILIKEGKFYEHLELKMRNTEGIKLFKLNDYPQLKYITQKCKQNVSESGHNNVYTYNNWVKSKVIKNHEKFVISKVLISRNFTINSFLTNGNILLQTATINISMLPDIMRKLELSGKDVLFYDDLTNKTYDVSVSKLVLQILYDKCETLALQCNIGKIMRETETTYYTKLALPVQKYSDEMMMHTNNRTIFHERILKMKNYEKKWFELQQLVAVTLVKHFLHNAVGLAEINGMERKEKIKTLLSLFDSKIPFRNHIQIILEELNTESIQTIQQWLNSVIILYKYNYMSDSIQDIGNEFVFSQNVFLRHGKKYIADKLLAYHEALPNKNTESEDAIENIQLTSDKSNAIASICLELPSIFKGSIEKLGTKWVMHKKSKWSNMVYIKSHYNKNSIKEFTEWLTKCIGFDKVHYQDILNISRQKYYTIMNNRDAMILILQEPSFYNQWLLIARRKFATVQQFYDTFYAELTEEQRLKYLNSILDKNEIYPNDLHILSISELLNITILVLHRGKYGKFDTNEATRGELSDLVVSSTLYPALSNMKDRPFIIFNKIHEKNYNSFNLVVDKHTPDKIYMKYEEVPLSIRMLTDAHLEIVS